MNLVKKLKSRLKYILGLAHFPSHTLDYRQLQPNIEMCFLHLT